jgi:hypothetical protein
LNKYSLETTKHVLWNTVNIQIEAIGADQDFQNSAACKTACSAAAHSVLAAKLNSLSTCVQSYFRA